jgi:hypothetical protein
MVPPPAATIATTIAATVAIGGLAISVVPIASTAAVIARGIARCDAGGERQHGAEN